MRATGGAGSFRLPLSLETLGADLVVGRSQCHKSSTSRGPVDQEHGNNCAYTSRLLFPAMR